jgi:hypothetical protein
MFGTRDDDDEIRETRRSSIELTRRRSSWHLASFAGLILALSSGCKDSNGGNGPIDDDGGEDDGGKDGGSNEGGNPPPVDSGADAGPDSGGPDGGSIIGGDAGNDGGSGGGDGGNDSGVEGILNKASVEFGLSPCGGDAPGAQTFTITNSGTAPVTYTVTLSNTTAFSFEGSAGGTKSGTAAPGTSATITLNAAAVPASATAGVATTGTATITTNLPAPNNSIVVPVSIVPQGAHLQLSPAGGADWLLVQTGEEPEYQPLALQNTGNLPAAVTLTQPVNTAFKLFNGTSTTEEAASVTVPAATNGTTPGSSPFNASFAPQSNGGYTSTAALAVAGAVCNGGTTPSLTQIPFEGAASANGLSVRRTPFADKVNCGATTLPTTTFTLRNNTPAAMTVAINSLTAVTGGTSPFTISNNALNLPGQGGSATFDVTLKGSEAPSTATPGTGISDSISIEPSDPGVNQRAFTLSTTIQGSVLSWDNLPGVGGFDGANNVATTAKTITVKNTGNLPATPSFVIDPGDGIFTQTAPLSPAQVPTGSVGSPGAATLGVTFRPPVNDVNVKNAMLKLVPNAADVICGTLPADVPLNGTPNTPGFTLTSPNPYLFGSAGAVDCPLPSAPNALSPFGMEVANITFQNNGQSDLEWTATVDNTGVYNLSAATGTIPGNMSAVGSFTVTAADFPFPPSLVETAYDGNLTITTNIQGDTPHVIPLKRRARGAVITTDAINATFGDVNVNFVSETLDLFTISNTGNADANVVVTGTVNSTSTRGPIYALDGIPATKGAGNEAVLNRTVANGTPITIDGYFDPVVDNMFYDPSQDQVTSMLDTTITTTSPLCAAIAPTGAITGTGDDNVNFNVPGALSFAASNARHACGSNRAESPQTLIITNYSTTDALTIDSIVLDNNSWFSAYIGSQGVTSGTVPAATVAPDMSYTPGVAVAIVVPKTVPPSANAAASELTATLTITASLPGTTPITRNVNITEFINCTQP